VKWERLQYIWLHHQLYHVRSTSPLLLKFCQVLHNTVNSHAPVIASRTLFALKFSRVLIYKLHITSCFNLLLLGHYCSYVVLFTLYQRKNGKMKEVWCCEKVSCEGYGGRGVARDRR